MEAKRDQLEAEAEARLQERTQEIDALKTRAAELSSRLEVTFYLSRLGLYQRRDGLKKCLYCDDVEHGGISEVHIQLLNLCMVFARDIIQSSMHVCTLSGHSFVANE